MLFMASRLLVSGVYSGSNGKTPGENEQWPGKVCVLCNLTEHSQLGQGKMCRVECTVEELPKEIPKELLMSPPETPPIDATSPRHQAQLYQNRRQKGMAKFRNAHGSGQEPVDELSLVGHTDAPEASSIVDAGFIYVHEWCASWCAGITKKHDSFLNVPFAVMAAANRRCYHCSRYGAGGACIVPSCNKHFHTPCAAAAATFQYTESLILICSQHIEHVETNSALSGVVCYTCNSLGNVGNLVMCSMCGKHHHGACIGNALQPVGWKCKRCRLCSDCGARTPGGGLSSRWHSNYTVCDSCYQQRNKGFSCPVCHKAYRAAALREMVRCSQCHRYVHGTCDKEADFVSYHRKKEAHPDYEYICLSCKNNSTVHFMKRKDSTDDIQFDSNLSVSQDSLMANDDADGDSEKSDDTSRRFSMVGLGKGKPFYATKIAKKRLGLSTGPGRPKGSGKLPSVTSALSNFQKKHKFSDFGRKRGSKTKIRGMFGVPGLALQSPTWSSSDPAPKSGDDEPGCENKIILCASKEKFVLGQDVCVMCGALGIDQEACLICCSQCGQCFHPYCVTVKVTKCKWCALCLTCGATSPGINSNWQSNFSQCGACASRTTCPACYELYTDGDLIIKCINCDRWLHCLCDTITTEQEAEAYCSQGYTCVLCRPANMPLAPPVTPTRAPSPEFPTEGKANDYYVDGVCLSETGLQQIKTLNLENSNQPVRRKRPGFKRSQENDLLNLDDGENENPNPVYKDGMVWGSKENGPVPSPPEGFSLSTSESGVVILKRKKQRNLQKLGIGGFSAVKMRSSRFKDDEEGLNTFGEDKPRRKPRCTKKRSKLAESYPSYLQEAFFGRELLDITKESTQELESEESEESDGEKPKVDHDKTISLSQDELKVMADVTAKKEKEDLARNSPCVSVKEEDMSDGENFKDILHLPDNLLHTDLVNTIMNERDGIKSEIDSGTHESNGDQKDELSEILGPNFSLDSIQTGLPNMDSKDVEEIFKGVLTHESQDAHGNSPLATRGPTPGTPSQAQVSPQQGLPSTVLSRSGSVTPAVHSNLPSPMGFPSASPYNSEYSNSPQFSPEGSQWGGDDTANNQKNSLRMEQDEALGQHATIAAVLYANVNCPELKQECPSWPERVKQVLRKWRNLPNEKRAPYVQLAKENRTNVRIKKTQQEQDKTTLNKTSREAEQERWKAMQVLRQQYHISAQPRAGTVYARTVLRPPGPAASPFSPPRQPPPEEMNRQLRDLLKGQHSKQETVIGENSVLATSSAGGQIRAQLAQVRTPQPLHQPNVQGVMDAKSAVSLAAAVSKTKFLRFTCEITYAKAAIRAIQCNGAAPAAVRSSCQCLRKDGEKIPDSVTAELEKLEQEGGSIAEAEAVSAILGDLVEDDDDALLAEMGADFNILAYADPELDDITDGDKTNLHIPHLDDLEEEVEKKKQSANEAKPAEAPQASNEQKPQMPQPKEEAPQPSQIVLPNRTPPSSLPVSVVATNNMAPSPPVTQQGTLVNHVLPAAKDKTFTPFVTPNTPLPRMQLMTVVVLLLLELSNLVRPYLEPKTPVSYRYLLLRHIQDRLRRTQDKSRAQ
ncbi:hypothetical protein GE061_018144 [Apolygus lucorum]|uniref:Histone-lysine N-methyltransferase n=1 Tax=Apolygus lucorum TaxID=248454 RepID=A0A8S9XF55_APOLU|nr:hypothetical protein GE061_018144 [Apolygus lucorum]